MNSTQQKDFQLCDTSNEVLAKTVRFLWDVLNRPYERGRCGPNFYDCYGLVRAYKKEVEGKQTPRFFGAENLGDLELAKFFARSQSSHFYKLPGPRHGAVAALGKLRSVTHCGICLNEGRRFSILHIERGRTVRNDSLEILNNFGFNLITFHDLK